MVKMVVCPSCKSKLVSGTKLVCSKCKKSYPKVDGMALMYPDQKDVSKELVDYYNKDYSKHTPSFHSEEAPLRIKEVLEILPKGFKCNSLLDVGCGAGQISLGLKKHLGLKKIVFLDIALGALKMVPKDKTNEYYVGLAENLPVDDDSIDLTIALDLLEHANNPKKVIREIRRCSKFLVLKSPLEKSFMRNLLHEVMGIIYGKDYWKKIFGHIHQFNRKDIYNVLEENGFEIKKQKLCTDIAKSVRSPIFRLFLYIQRAAFIIIPTSMFEKIFGGHLWVFAERKLY